MTTEETERRAMPDITPEEARAFFPRGLFQPKGSFRFSLDALLLASFLAPARHGQGERLLDLGSGCGVVALGMLRLHPGLEAVGLDIQPELAEAARINAARLGFAHRFTALCGDAAVPEPPGMQVESFSLVLANPPYRQRGRGRLPASRMRLTALFEEEGGLAAFCRAAERAITRDGRFGVVFPAHRLEDLLSALHGTGLTPVRLLPVHARAADPAMLVLAEAVKASAPPGRKNFRDASGPKTGSPPLDTPLVLHEDRGAAVAFTKQALDFCPFLFCNEHSQPNHATRSQYNDIGL